MWPSTNHADAWNNASDLSSTPLWDLQGACGIEDRKKGSILSWVFFWDVLTRCLNNLKGEEAAAVP